MNSKKKLEKSNLKVKKAKIAFKKKEKKILFITSAQYKTNL